MDVWGVVIFVLSVMRVVGGVPIWVVCVFRQVDVVCGFNTLFITCSTQRIVAGPKFLICCCCMPSETYGRATPVPPQAAGVVGTF